MTAGPRGAGPLGSFVVAARFCGPRHSANGGYVAGRLAGYVETTDERPAVEVTLRRPPPLGVRLEVTASDGSVVLAHEGVVVATASAVQLDGAPPPPVPFADAEAAAARYPGRTDHPFPTCFVCGTDRADGDGLRLQPGPVGGTGLVAAAWCPHPSLAGPPPAPEPGPRLAPEFAWAALDCPGGWASDLRGRPMVLGRMAAVVLTAPAVGQQCVVVGQVRGREGRKTFTASALYATATGDADLLAYARATWLEVADPAAVRPGAR